MHAKRFLAQTALAILCLLWPLVATAMTYSVDPSGADTNPGSPDQPFKTVAHAAAIVLAGDTVLVNPGTYTDEVHVTHTGTKELPITFLSVKRHGAVITRSFVDPKFSADAWGPGGPVDYVTVKGFKFDVGADHHRSGWMTASLGWRYEDCLFHGFGGICGRGGETAIIRCVFEDLDGSAFTYAFGDKWEVTDSVFRRCNQSAYSPGGYSGTCKILITNDCHMDGIISYDNYGSGWWLDTDNRDFSITNSTFFGNHAGQAHEQIGGKDTILNQSWAAAAIWLEINPGPGLVENNTIYSNMCGGIGLNESSNVIVRNNVIVDCNDGIELRALDRNDGNPYGTKWGLGLYGPNVITNNSIKWWHDSAICTVQPSTLKGVAKPALAGQMIDNNTYEPGPSQKIMRWVTTDVSSLAAARSTLGIEPNGKVAHIAFTPELVKLTPLMINETTDPAKMHQVHSAAAEKLSIDEAIAQANAKVGDEVVIPVFGRKAIAQVDKVAWKTTVYDLQGRYLPLTIHSIPLMKAMTTGVTQFAYLQPTYLKVKLTKLEEYNIEADALAVVSAPEMKDNTTPPVVTNLDHPMGVRDNLKKAKAGDTVVISFLCRLDIVDDPRDGKMVDVIDFEGAHITLHLADAAKVKLLEPIMYWPTGPYYMQVKLTKISKEKIEAIPIKYLE